MKIILTRRNGRSSIQPNAESYMRVVFAHISDKIWIKSVECEPAKQGFGLFNAEEKITVHCEPQGMLSESKELAQEVVNAIRLRGDLGLVKILLAAPTIEAEGISQIQPNMYNAKVYFSEYLARNDEYREEMKTSPVVKATFQLQEIGPDSYRPTGRISTITKGGNQSRVDPDNIYNLYAVALSTSPELRRSVLNDNVSRILLTLNESQMLGVDVELTKKYRYDFAAVPKLQQSDDSLENDMDNLHLDADSAPSRKLG